MRPHRFAFNFGYGFSAEDEAMTGAAFLFMSMFLELGLEVAVDSAAIDIEERHGIDVDNFWKLWGHNPGNFFGVHLCSSMLALALAFWSFSCLPTPFFCTSEHDPCSCEGGGFQIFKPFCDAAAATTEAAEEARKKMQSNATNNSSNSTSITAIPENAYVETAHGLCGVESSPPIVHLIPHNSRIVRSLLLTPPRNCPNSTLNYVKTSAKSEYLGIFESLGDGSTTIAVTVIVIIVISLIFMIARSKLFAAKVAAEAQREREEAEQREVELREQNRRIEEQNKRIQDQLMLTQLNEKQTAIVETNSVDLDKQVPAVFQLNWRDLLFEDRLGSGSFGDCYKGRYVYIFCALHADKAVQNE